MSSRPADARSWVARDAAVVWHGFTQMATYADNAPLVIDRAEGRELIEGLSAHVVAGEHCVDDADPVHDPFSRMSSIGLFSPVASRIEA